MSGRYKTLPDAMQILGARSIAVFSTATGSRIWSVTEGQPPIDEDVVTAAIDVVAAAQRLVDVADPGSPLDEILAVDTAWFHVLYLFTGQDTGPQVAHLLLDRGVANLAHARREFWTLVEAERAVHCEPKPSAGDVRGAPADTGTAPHSTNHTGLPRRPATAPARPEVPTGDEGSGNKTSWTDHFTGPFVTDVSTLERVLERLRRL